MGNEQMQAGQQSMEQGGALFTEPPQNAISQPQESQGLNLNEPTQSFKKYPTADEWVNGFLQKTIENCYNGLKPNKYMLINIANTPKYKFIEEETVRISKELGFKQEQTIELTLSSIMGAGYKYEPIFAFKK